MPRRTTKAGLMRHKQRFFAADFETTVYEGQEYTEVWAAGLCELNTEDVQVFHSIEAMFEYCRKLKCNVVLYFHNLKFDGSFWLWKLLMSKDYRPAWKEYADGSKEWHKEKDMPIKSFKYSISELGQWYNIIIRVGRYYIEVRDSLKLMPMSLESLGASFKTKHRKLSMEYKGRRFAGCRITDSEMAYIKNDVLVLKEALEVMFEEGHTRLTIGSCCLHEFKEILKHSVTVPYEYEEIFPDLTRVKLDSQIYGSADADGYIRHSYKGGWTYLVKGREQQVVKGGLTADVNSLYPSVMEGASGNAYPVGLPTFWKGNYIDGEALKDGRYYFIRFKCRFQLKPGMLPTVQIKGSLSYKGTEWLESSDVIDTRTGERIESAVTLTMSQVDFRLMREHYNLYDVEVLDGCWFRTMVGVFDEYIHKYAEIKMTSTGARREIAKLFLNNLYGKLASSKDSSYKVAYIKEDGSLGFELVEAHEKEAGYIAAGAAVTSYARDFTIRAAQENFHGVGKRGFIYADTDSIHCDLEPWEVRGIKVDPVKFLHWKLESYWDEAVFVRQKTYIEHVTHKDGDMLEKPYYQIKCAGMNKACKSLLGQSLEGAQEYKEGMDPDVEAFLFNGKEPIKRGLMDFKPGLKVPKKLRPKQVRGGVLLTETTFEMR